MKHITSANDAVGNLKYHLRCRGTAKKQVAITDKFYANQKTDAEPNVIVDIEIINILQTELSNLSHKVITTNRVESKYGHLLVKHGTLEEDLHKSY